MGGRGGAGLTAKRDTFSAPNMQGSEKQVSWAKSIIEQPYEMLQKNASNFDARAAQSGAAIQRKYAQAYREAAQEYAKQINQTVSGQTIKAGTVIDGRGNFQSVADRILREKLKKYGLS